MYAECLVKRNVYTLSVIPVPIVNGADVRTMLAKDEMPCAGCILRGSQNYTLREQHPAVGTTLMRLESFEMKLMKNRNKDLSLDCFKHKFDE